jgi:cytochrome P450
MEDSSSNRLDRIERGLESVAAHTGRLAESQHKLNEAQAKLANAQPAQPRRSNNREDPILDVEAEHRRLLRAQVLIAEELRELAAQRRQFERSTDERLNALIAVVDDFIRRQQKQ